MQLYRTQGPMGEQYIQADEVDFPDWIEWDCFTDKISEEDEEIVWVSSIKDVVNGGCASGSYMPAVIYTKAMDTMKDHGDEVLQYIWEQLGEIPEPTNIDGSCFHWSSKACFYLSVAVELWASGLYHEIEEAEEAA